LGRSIVATELIEHGTSSRENRQSIVGAMGAAEHAEGLLEIAVVRRRPPLSGQQRLGLGLNNRGLLDYRDRLRAVPRGANANSR